MGPSSSFLTGWGSLASESVIAYILMDDSMDNIDKLYQEAYRLSEKRLEAQQASAMAADTRAMAFAGICLAAAAVLGGLAKDASSPVMLLVGAFLLGLGAFLSGYSARPVDFFMPGAKFSDLQEDIDNDEDFHTVITQLGGFADSHSETNHAIMTKNANMFQWALWIAVAGIATAVMPQLYDALAVASTASANP